MKKNLLKTLLFFAAAFQAFGLFAQNDGDIRSAASGSWGDNTTWEQYDADAGTWVAAAAVPPSSSVITIRNGHTISLDGTKTAFILNIENGGVLKSDGTGTGVKNMRIANTLNNNGSFGASGSNERVNIEPYLANGTVTITSSEGTGNFLVGTIRANGLAETLEVLIDADLNLNSYMMGYYSLTSGSNTALQDDDNVTITINSGRTVTMTGSGAYLHAASGSTTITVDKHGNYTYNINGTLDMSAAGTSCIVEHSSLPRTVTVNVNGTWKIGNAIRTASAASSPTAGSVKLNIGTNGLVDASVAGGTNLVMSNNNSGKYTFFNITGNGVLRQNPSKHAAQTTFRVGADNVYTPVTFNNLNAVIDVNVQSAADGGKKMVNKVWKISSTADPSEITLARFQFTTDAGANGFSVADPTMVYYWNAGAWGTGIPAATSGDGTLQSPYRAELSSLSAFGEFSVANEVPAVLPLKFLAFSAKPDLLGRQVKLNWRTAEEVNTLNFVIEKSTDGKTFTAAGMIDAKGGSGINSYSFNDYNPSSGIAYYRIKQQDKDGKYDYSNLVDVSFSNGSKITIYPNPAAEYMNVSHPELSSGKITVYSLAGRSCLVQHIAKGSSQSVVDISQLPAAIYILELRTDSETAVHRFVKQ